ncbi:GTPase Der [uncultured archaeon]|nr:GTPase Der [uncultured archaeon]
MQQFIRKRQPRDTNIEPYWDLIKRIITESDLVLEVIDARLVELSRNEELEKLIEEIGRPFIFVVNKSDLVNRDKLGEQIKPLLGKAPVIFVSNRNKMSYKILLSEIKKVFSEFGKREIIERKVGDPKVKFREAKADIVVGVLGYPNVGKSSIINGLTHKKKMKVSKKAGTTHGIHWINLGDDIKLIDSPGVIPLNRDDEVRYGLIGARDNESLKHPEVVSHAIIKLFLKQNKRKFEDFYEIDIGDEEESDTYSIIEKIAIKRSFLLKGGVPDENRANTLIIRDWQDGRLRL